jgi:N-alpha-acetyl-L-2,4-diaminobutyrate deacetylase
LVEHCVELVKEVRSGQVIAEIDNIERTGSPSQEYYAIIDGSYSGRHFSGLITSVDCLGVIAVQI